MLMNPLSFRAFILAASAVVCFIFISTVVPRTPEQLSAANIRSTFQRIQSSSGNDFSQNARNRTLGFEKIFSIGFANRGDRRDVLTIASSLTDIDITRADAVSFTDMAQKSVNENWTNKPQFNFTGMRNLIASQRAHLNALDYVIENRISTALILEDDVDWDYHIKDQVDAIATAFRGLQENETGKVDIGSPYGDGWDVLWLGHCRAGTSDYDETMYVLSNDPTVPPLERRHAQWKNLHVPDVLVENNTRVAFKLQRGVCTFGYAVTLQGAQKIVSAVSFTGNAQPFDSAMNDLFRGALKVKVRAFGVYPPIFSTHRFAGSLAKDSDISTYSEQQNTSHAEYSWDIVFSVVQNALRLLSGARTVLSQWPGVTTVDERSIDEPLQINVAPTQIKWRELPTFTDHPAQLPKSLIWKRETDAPMTRS